MKNLKKNLIYMIKETYLEKVSDEEKSTIKYNL